MEPELRYVQSNGIRLHVALSGPEDGELVILLHGFPEFWAGMRAPLEAFAAAGYRVAAPDQRGYHLSDKPTGVASYRIDTLAADVLGLIDALGFERAHVIGHDWGAAVTWWLAAHHPDRLGRVAVVNVPHPAVLADALRRSPRQLGRSWYMLAFQIPRLPERAFTGRVGEQLSARLAGTARRGSFTPAYLAQLRAAWAQPGAATAMLNWYRAALRGPRPEGWRQGVSIPLLILWGARDAFLGEELATGSLAYCDEGHLMVLDDATHWVLHDDPDLACSLLLDWVAGRDLGP